jgi:hypothetical protein
MPDPEPLPASLPETSQDTPTVRATREAWEVMKKHDLNWNEGLAVLALLMRSVMINSREAPLVIFDLFCAKLYRVVPQAKRKVKPAKRLSAGGKN